MFLGIRRWFSAKKLSLIATIKGNSFALRTIGVRVGEASRIYTRSFLGEPWLVSIGDRVTVAPGVYFITHDASSCLIQDEKGRRYRYARITVGNDVFIGANAIILPGVRIGNRVIVGAGSVVNRSIPDNCVVGGVPARFLRTFDEFERRGLATFHSEAHKSGKTFREQVDSMVDETMAPEISVPTSAGAVR